MSGPAERHVVVVGAGIGGMAAALLIARSGARVTLVERVPAPGAVGAGLLLQPNGLAVLHGLGLGAAVEAAGHPMRAADVRRADGRLVLHAPIRDHGAGLDHVLAIRRSALYGVLLAEITRTRLITTVLGAEVAAVDAAGDVRLADGRHIADADLVIGADGTSSAVRASGDFAADVRDTGATYLRATVEGDDRGLHGEHWTRLGVFGGAPLGDGSTYFYAAAHAPAVAAAIAGRDLPALRALWAEAMPLAGRLLGAVARFDDLLVNRVARVDAGRWADGVLVLIGDAAHAMSPTLGQGANSALVDAAVLAHELAPDDPVADAVERYVRRRRAAVRRVQDAADRVSRLSNASGSFRTSVIDRTLRLAAVAGPLATRQDRLIQQEDPALLLETVTRLNRRDGDRRPTSLSGRPTCAKEARP